MPSSQPSAPAAYGKRPMVAGAPAPSQKAGMIYPANAPPCGSRFGDDVDEAGAMGDQIDTLSVRDVATVRYVRHHEWLELVVGSGLDTNKIVPPKVIPESQSQLWTFELESLKKKLEATEQEVKLLEAQREKGWILEVNQRNKDLGDFFRQGTAKLREQFGTISDVDIEAEMVQELEDRFQLRIIERERLKRVGIDLGLDKPKQEQSEQANVGETDEKINDDVFEAGPSTEQIGDHTLDIVPSEDLSMEDVSEDVSSLPTTDINNETPVDCQPTDVNANDILDQEQEVVDINDQVDITTKSTPSAV